MNKFKQKVYLCVEPGYKIRKGEIISSSLIGKAMPEGEGIPTRLLALENSKDGLVLVKVPKEYEFYSS